MEYIYILTVAIMWLCGVLTIVRVIVKHEGSNLND